MRILHLIALISFILPIQAAFGAPVFEKSGVAISGYDTVAYFTKSDSVKGEKQFSTEWNGSTWRFSSSENLEKFKADPEKYAPQYGGYCAWGLGAKGELFPIDPDVWRIVDGKLYLNYDSSIQRKWLKDVPGFIQKADNNWVKHAG